MKKLLSCLLAVIIAFSAISVAVFAADNGFDNASCVSVAPGYEKMIAICDPVKTDSKGNPVPINIQYLEPHSVFKFKVVTLGDYKFDLTTEVKVAPVSYLSDIAFNNEVDRSYIVEPDENGIYTIESVDEDLYVYVVNMNSSSVASVKTFVLKIFNAIMKFFKWVFGIEIPEDDMNFNWDFLK